VKAVEPTTMAAKHEPVRPEGNPYVFLKIWSKPKKKEKKRV